MSHTRHSNLRVRLRFDRLEARDVPATFTVMNDNDAGPGSLRQAIVDANRMGGADIINFDATFFSTPRAIGLNDANDMGDDGYTINDSVTINGPGAANLAIRGNGNSGHRSITIDSAGIDDGGMASSNTAGTAINVSINNASITGAATTDGVSGGALNNNGENVTLESTAFVFNELISTANVGGGAIANENGGTLTIRRSSFVQNSTAGGLTSGGAILASMGTTVVENSTFFQNFSGGSLGGGAIRTGSNSNLTLVNSTIIGNAAAGMGGGVLTDALAVSATLTGNIIYGNSNTATMLLNDVHTQAPAPVAGSGFNDIDVYTNVGGASPALTAGTNGNISVDPQLNNSRTLPNGTFALIPDATSPVIGAIPAGALTTTIDQAGTLRPQGTNGDMGAFEFVVSVSGGGSGSTSTPTANPGGVNATTPPPTQQATPDPRVELNQQVIANLQAVFAQPLPPQIALAVIVQIADVNGDGFNDVIALVGLRIRLPGGRTGIQLFRLVFDGLSTTGALIGVPQIVGVF